MARRSDTSLATLLLVTRIVPSDVKPLSAREFWAVVDVIEDPAALLGVESSRLAAMIGDKLAARVAELLDRAPAAAVAVEQFEQSGVRTITAFDDDYPARLRARLAKAAPAVLHVAGAPALMQAGGVAIVGSRDVSVDAAEAAKNIARAAADEGRVVVSGGARGTDRLAMNAALDAGGCVVGVLADALTRTANDPEVRRAIADERLCLATPYAPSAPFSAGNAMGRNKILYALADVTVVVACEEGKGGTWSGATEALSHGYGDVAVWLGAGAGPANHVLASKGAAPVDASALAVSGDTAVTSADEQLHMKL
jgi:predicted Rossmann fold nucleotide-binding protein DprA/Smf involved in DNA uptake